MPDQSITLIDPTSNSSAGIGHLVNGFRNSNYAKPSLIAEAFDVLDARSSNLENVLRTAFNVSFPITVDEWTLVAASTDITPSIEATPAGMLIVIITCDGTDGRAITWDTTGTMFKGVAVDDIDNRASKVNIYTFVGRTDSKWWCISTRLGLA